MNSIGIGGSASTEGLSEAKLESEGLGAELPESGVGFDESLHPIRETRAIGAMSLPSWVNDIAP